MTPRFTTPCFIRKNTPELRNRLEELGYIAMESCYDTDDDYLQCNYVADGDIIMFGYYVSFSDGHLDDDECIGDNGIDCGANEQMFLALAALRDDSDFMQWFTDGTLWECGEKPSRYMMMEGHKATADEIVENFKNKQL